MKESQVLKGILLLLGVPLVVLGSWRILDPIGFFDFNGLLLIADAGLLSEARGAGGAIVGFGLLIILGAFKRKLAYTSTIAAVTVYLSYGIARVIGLVVDGNPGDKVLQGITG